MLRLNDPSLAGKITNYNFIYIRNSQRSAVFSGIAGNAAMGTQKIQTLYTLVKRAFFRFAESDKTLIFTSRTVSGVGKRDETIRLHTYMRITR